MGEGIQDQSAELRLSADSALSTTEIAPLIADGIGADSTLTVTLRLGPPDNRVNVNFRDLISTDEVAFGQALPGFDLELDDVNQTEGSTRQFRLIPIDAGGNPILFSAGDQGSITFRQEANTTAVASPRVPPNDIPVPATMMLLGTGLLGLGVVSMNRTRRRKNA